MATARVFPICSHENFLAKLAFQVFGLQAGGYFCTVNLFNMRLQPFGSVDVLAAEPALNKFAIWVPHKHVQIHGVVRSMHRSAHKACVFFLSSFTPTMYLIAGQFSQLQYTGFDLIF